ncbi:MAG: dihydrolipoyl dehydrogenase [Deltaproteobacteria bacterium]|nr:dihydrolipoyl dehydrogenase [Deltaproteobacteria bacterium]
MTLGVIGGGPGGYVAALRAAQLGAEVTLIEQGKLGGVCLNVGCIPTKALLHAAEVFVEAGEGRHCGVLAEPELDFTKVQSYKEGVVKRLVNGVGSLLKAAGVTVVYGTASFKNARALLVESNEGARELTFDKIIIATGSIPAFPPIPGINSPRCIDSTGALALESVPASLVIIGGGVIGMEMATVYNSFGSKVQVVEMLDEILPMLDRDITKAVRADISGKGVEIFTGAKVLEIKDQGGEAVVVAESGGRREFKAEKVLVAIGRKTNTAALNLDAVGIGHDRGRITVNDKMETSLPGVYAIGDCNGRIMLAHVASDQGEIAAENALCGGNAVFRADTNPSCVYTSPECAGVGLTEEQAKAQGLEYVTGKFPLLANGKALIMNGGKGLIKIIAGARYKELLGVHIFGPRATDLIAEAALGLRLEATMDEIISTIHAHPTLAEAFREAALAVEKRAIHIPNR